MSKFYREACVFPRTDGLTGLAVSARRIPMPAKHERDVRRSRDKLRELRVSRIVAICGLEDATSLEHHHALYEELGIAWHFFPMEDTEDEPVPATLLPWLLTVYGQHDPASGIILLHCMSGVNRSMLAAALLLWHTTPAAAELWPSTNTHDGEHVLIAWMDEHNRAQRKSPYMLTNTRFRRYIADTCRPTNDA